MTEPNSITRVAYSVPSRWDDKTIVDLRIEDALSGEVLADMQIPADAWLRLMTGGTYVGESFTTPNPERIGKVMQNEAVDIGWSPTMTSEESESWARLGAASHPLAAEYETQEVHRTNSGWRAVFRRWVTPTAELLAERRERLIPER